MAVMIDEGSGPALVLIPGLDGHCEWLRPTIAALARDLRVLSFSLCGERRALANGAGERRAFGRFDADCDQVEAALDRAGIDRAVIAGISYGGWVALHFAATRPARTAGLALISSPPPGFVPSARQAQYLRRPRLMAPVFVLTGPMRLGPEVRTALPDWRERLRFSAGHLARTLRTGLSPTRMAARMGLAAQVDLAADCRRITAPTLIVTGEPGLDRVVPVEETRRYAALLPHAEMITLPRTGHMGTLTRPEPFRELIAPFVRRAHLAEAREDGSRRAESREASPGTEGAERFA